MVGGLHFCGVLLFHFLLNLGMLNSFFPNSNFVIQHK